MMLNQLEQAILVRFFESEGFGKVSVDLSQIKIAYRHLTGSGFMTQLEPNQLVVLNGPSSFTGGCVEAKINGTIEAGFLFYIKQGYVDAIEGYTHNGEEWPDEVRTFELYLVDFSSGQKKS